MYFASWLVRPDSGLPLHWNGALPPSPSYLPGKPHAGIYPSDARGGPGEGPPVPPTRATL
jgi:hypothetical protein